MAEDQRKHDAREQAHDAGIEGASKMATSDAKEAVQKVRHGEDPQEAKSEAKSN